MRLKGFPLLKKEIETMAILIDDPIWSFRGEHWAHLVSDESYEELHKFAGSIGIPKHTFQGDHYDIPKRLWQTAVDAGALPTEPRVLVKRLKEAGLRKRKSSNQ
jgi:hypothetical protein